MANKCIKQPRARERKHDRYHARIGEKNCPLHKKQAAMRSLKALAIFALLVCSALFPSKTKAATLDNFLYFEADSAIIYNWTATNFYRAVYHSSTLDLMATASAFRLILSASSPAEIISGVYDAYPSYGKPSFCTSTTTLCSLGGGNSASTSPITVNQNSGGGLFDDVNELTQYIYWCDSDGLVVGGSCLTQNHLLSSPIVHYTEIIYNYASATATVVPSPTVNTTTRIVDFSPADNAELPAVPVIFSLHAYVNPDDIGTFIGVRFTLENIDQNVLLFTSFSPASFFLLDGFEATSSGNFYYTSVPKILGEGNYMVSATLERSYIGGWIVNPFSPITETVTHQFSVGSSSFIGNIQQKAFSDLQTFFASSTATSTDATSRDCNPLAFDVKNCMAYLLIPSQKDLTNSILGIKDQVLTRVPWGYPTRFYNILSGTATTALPSFTVNLHLGAGNETNPATSTLTFDPDDMLNGGAALVNSLTDRTYGKTIKEITEPLVRGGISLLVLFIIIGDVLGGTMGGEGGSSGGRTGMQKQTSLTRKEYTF